MNLVCSTVGDGVYWAAWETRWFEGFLSLILVGHPWATPRGFPRFCCPAKSKKIRGENALDQPSATSVFWGGRRLRRGLSVIVEDDVVSRKARLWPWDWKRKPPKSPRAGHGVRRRVFSEVGVGSGRDGDPRGDGPAD